MSEQRLEQIEIVLQEQHAHFVDPGEKRSQGRSLQRALEKKRQGIGGELPPGEGVLEDKWHP